MANKIKKLFVLGSLVSSLFIALAGCEFNSASKPSSSHSRSSIDSSSVTTQNSSSNEPSFVLESITATSRKTSYEIGEELELNVRGHYSNNLSFVIDDGYEVSGFNNRVPGEQTITVTYLDKTCTLTVIVNEPVLVSITAINNKDSYEYGDDQLDLTVYANYSDGSSIEVTEYQVSGFNSKRSGEQEIFVYCFGKRAPLTIKVNDPILTDITATSEKQMYEYGEDLSLVVEASYSDNSTVTVTDYTVEGYDATKPGEQTITVRYENKVCTLVVLVNDPVLVSINATSAKDTYEYGEDINLVVKAHYSDDSDVVVNDYTVEGYDATKPGEQTVTVIYENETYTLKVKVNNPVLKSITAISNKQSYKWYEELDLTVYAKYSDDSTTEVSDYAVEGFNGAIPGVQTLTITYENKTCHLDVIVEEKVNLFPDYQLDVFKQLEGIQTDIPLPTGYYEWTASNEEDQDGTKYFLATTRDEGTVGVDTITEQYALLLRQNDWTVVADNNGYTASKEGGDATLYFNTQNKVFSLRVELYEEFPSTAHVGTVVSSTNSLKDGDTIVLGNVAKELMVTELNDGSMNTDSCSYTDEQPDSIGKNVTYFTLKKSGNYWSLLNYKGKKLGATGVNQLAWDEGSTTWSISFSGKLALITNSTRSNGRLYYNANNKKVSTYATNTSGDAYSYPQIFKVETVDLVYPSAISISGSNTVALGKTAALSVEYTPNNANVLKEVAWSSSNDNIATVDNGVVTAKALGDVVITATTRSKNEQLEASFNLSVVEQALDKWTIFLYVCGADLESESSEATTDIAEILSVGNQPDDINIVLQTGGAKRWQDYNISSSVLSRYHVEDQSLVLDETLSNASMGKQSTLEAYLNWGLDKYPAEKTGVIFWNHGGALGGCCYDENYNDDSLLNSEVSSAFKNVFQNNGISQLEFVGYDCCLMQVQDIAQFNSKYFKYMIGSEEAESGYGWDYDNWVDDLYAYKDTPTVLKAVCDSFIASTGGTSSRNNDQTLSYLDLSKMNDYYTKFEALAASIKTTAKSNYSSFKTLLRSVKDYGDTDDYWGNHYDGIDLFGTIDGYDFLDKLAANSTYSAYKSQIDEVKTAYKNLVAYSTCGKGAGNSNGLEIIVSISSSVSYSSSETSFTNWRSIFK